MLSDPIKLAHYRRKLRYAWQPFFSRFGRLTEIQLAAIPEVMRGHNVMVCAPTASGKTEAIIAPVAERHRQENWNGLAVVYLTPTRALGNDLELRLAGPLEEMYLHAVLRHGEQSYLPTSRPIDWLITTPESLDSLLCRRTSLFTQLRTVILDEIHLLDGTYRGDQLRVLLRRLAQITTTGPLDIHLLSATLADPEGTAHRYVETVRLITATGARPVEYHLVQTHKEIWALARAQQWRKLLYFCNTRRGVEETAGQLQALWRPYPVVAHHGSLDRRQREEAEEVMRQASAAVCVATSTLEIGIDIGDIDLVVLADPPWSLESLQQRIGRGSRRQEIIQAAALYQTPEELDHLQALFDAASRGYYTARGYTPDLSVIVQQTLSILYQQRTGIALEQLVDLLSVLAPPEIVETILFHLMHKGFCLWRGNALFPSSELLDLGDEGKIHSNIPDRDEHVVIDVASNREIGRIRGTYDRVFLLAGHSWKVVSVQGDRIYAQRHPHGMGTTEFGIHRNVGQFYYLLPPDLRTG